MNAHHKEVRLLAEQAAEWLYRLETADLEEKTTFVRWLRQSPLHVREILIAAAWNDVLRGADPNHLRDIDALATKGANVISLIARLAPTEGSLPAADTGDTEAQLTAIPEPQPVKSPSNTKVWIALAGVALLLVFAMVLGLHTPNRRIESGAGEWVTRTPGDGLRAQERGSPSNLPPRPTH